MKLPLRQIVPLAATVAVALCALPSSGAMAAATISPLPSSNYTVRAACANPTAGRAGCLALKLVPVTAEARRHRHPIGSVRAASRHTSSAPTPAQGDFGLTPKELHTAYSLPETAPPGQTIALVDAYNNLTAEQDLKTYSEEFGLPLCTTENGCFRKVGQTGSSETSGLPFPKSTAELEAYAASGEEEKEIEAEEAVGWGGEIALDIESAHAVCPNCHILLVEAKSTFYSDLEAAEKRAALLGATEISNSWGGPEEGIGVAQAEASFSQPGIVTTASTGDNGFLGWAASSPAQKGFAEFPASFPHVVAVGGTHLKLKEGTRLDETVWNGNGASGGACSVQFTAPEWQLQTSDWPAVGCPGTRAQADVAADADPYTGVPVMYSSPECETPEHVHWCTYGGTSLASPIIAAVYALAGGANGAQQPARTLYDNLRNAPGTLHDVTVGSNGKCASGYNSEGISKCAPAAEAAASCSSHLVCLAAPGYDGPSGVGTPNGVLGFVPGQQEAGAAQEGGAPPAGPSSTPAPKPPTPAPTQLPAPAPATLTPALSRLGLTTAALIALNRSRPTIARIGFSFTLNIPSRLRVTLATRLRRHGRATWVTVGGAAAIPAPAGRSAKKLTGRRRLRAGLYRLTVTPAGGRSQSLVFHIG